MKEWFQAHWKTVTLGVLFFFLFFLIIVPNLLRFIINGPWVDFWPHQKTSPEVDASFVNAIIGFLTVGVTVLATYLINRQTIKETAKMNNETQKLMIKQLEIQEQQARSTLRDYVYQQRVEFYLLLVNKINKIESLNNYILDENYKYLDMDEEGDIITTDEQYDYHIRDESLLSKKISELEDQLKTIIRNANKHLIATPRLQKILEEYIYLCDYIVRYLEFLFEEGEGIFEVVYHAGYSLKVVRKYGNLIREMIYQELNLGQIDKDMDGLLDSSSKQKLHELTEEAKKLLKQKSFFHP